MKKFLVIGSGGREHALCWALKRSPLVCDLFCMPGNAGIADIAACLPVNPSDKAIVVSYCEEMGIDYVFVGPEQPLVDGLVDALEAAGIKVFGPSAKAAQLEGSKDFTKSLCTRYHIPTAAYGTFTDEKAALDWLDTQSAPIVVKADGLAAGKGVIIAASIAEAKQAVKEMFAGAFGAAGNKVVIEEFLEGEEISFFALVDGETAIEFGSAQDHKRVGDGDTGPNTGGMGTYSPAPALTDVLRRQVMETIILPSVKGMARDGAPFRGVLFAGLMLTKDGPKLLEYNTRFGDPETQVLMARLTSDFAEIVAAGCEGRLQNVDVTLDSATAAVCVVMAAKGYPGEYRKGTEIRNLEEAAALPGVTVFHAGTRRGEKGEMLASGGRVLGVTATGTSIAEARDRAYAGVDAIDWPEGFCRRDIAWRALKRQAA